MNRTHLAANCVHAYDGDFNSLELRVTAMVMAGREPRKPGLYDLRIAADKALRMEATYRVRPEVKRDIMIMLYGGTPQTLTGKRLKAEGSDMYAAMVAALGLSYTEHGDFAHLSGRGI